MVHTSQVPPKAYFFCGVTVKLCWPMFIIVIAEYTYDTRTYDHLSCDRVSLSVHTDLNSRYLFIMSMYQS